ncbi:MAG: hypothetical protein E6R03_00845 [Hyphomicrobiaceae bacterium]|nr:MAG: hypothetical protein E6R03_00845 [Hyphomicrobiaceae bacterium]
MKNSVALPVAVIAICTIAIAAVICVAGWFVYMAVSAKREMDLSAQLRSEVDGARIRMLQHSMSKPHFELVSETSAEISGSITNTAGIHLTSIAIEYSVMDRHGRKSDSVSTFIRNLKPLEVWTYRIHAFGVSDDSKIALDSIRVTTD